MVRDLGVSLDQELIFAPHRRPLSRTWYYQLSQLVQLHAVSRTLSHTATITLVQAFVTSGRDYCSLLYGGFKLTKLILTSSLVKMI